MNPRKIVLFIFFTLSILLAVTFLSKSYIREGEGRESGFELGKLFIKYPTVSEFLLTNKPEVNTRADSVISIIEKSIPVEEFVPSIPDFSSIDTSEVLRIQYPGNKSDFTARLKSQLESGTCRILHYGDSQLEGDRISGYLRNRLQGIYGGNGPGFIPVKQVYNQVSADVICSDNWLRFAVFDPTQPKLAHKEYGLYASLSRFTPFDHTTVDSLTIQSLPPVKADIQINPSAKSYTRLKSFSKIGLHYGNAVYPVSIKVFNNGQLIKEGNLIADNNYHCYEIITDGRSGEIHIELESICSPDFYGLTLDGNSGISLDNIAMRGSSGTVFSGMKAGIFSRMAGLLNPEIIIFQYGGNTVPYVKDSVAIDNYARYLMGHINWVRRFMPDASIIFIGPTDMSTMENGEMVTYQLLPYLNDKLRSTCLKNGIAYWSMYEAMGGKNSMPFWVEQKLAANDYTHFSPQGTKIISELFFTALYLDLAQ